APQPSPSSPAPVAAASAAEPPTAQEPATPPFAPDFAAAGHQLSKLMSGMAAPLSRLAGTVPGLLSSASTSIAQAAKGKPSVAVSKSAPVESTATAPEVNTAEAKPIEVKPIEVDVKVDTIAPASSSAASTPTVVPLSGSSTASAPKPITTVTWNPATTISSLQHNAKKKSIGYCARAVVDAIQAGGTKIERVPAAKDLGSKLIAAGFTAIFSMPRPSREYDRSNLLPGDVVVLEGFNKDERKGIKKDHTFGHAAMYDGSKWISDFTQSGFYPGEDYRKALPGYTIYRMAATQAQINAINSSQRGESAPQTPVAVPSVPVTQTTRSSAPVTRSSTQAVQPSAPASRIIAPAPRPTTSRSVQSENKPISSDQDFLNEFNIDISFLRVSEEMKTDGYVPLNQDGTPVGNSGVTIGMGIDLGQREAKDLIRDGVPSSIVEKLKPYMKLKKANALHKIREMPLKLTSNEASILSNIYIQKSIRSLETEFDNESKGVKFSQLSANTRTMILDLAHQYGNLKSKTPKAWGFIINQQWGELVRELNNFHDEYPTRRKREATLIEDDLKNSRI
ncbi:pesticin C-terminus-like muramidase, partial [Dickeya dianthicola]|uniref:pesticin C-terminus-like muramidase n=3 Tax=Dickeya dianthicola TaxID=204039 RepID=UPI001E317FB9